MIFRQLYDHASSTYSYLIASRLGGEALLIDPVLENNDRYIQLANDLDLRLVLAVDTHIHADHITGLGALRERTGCITAMGEMTHSYWEEVGSSHQFGGSFQHGSFSWLIPESQKKSA